MALRSVRGPARPRRPAIGQSGAGKSTYIGREVHLAALDGRQVIALDGKGDRAFVAAVTDAYLAARPDATIHVFPDQPLDGWRGDAAAQVNRMLGCWQWSLESDWYKQQATLALRLACSAPGPPVDCMTELVRRLDPPTLTRLWAKQPTEAALVKMLTPGPLGVRPQGPLARPGRGRRVQRPLRWPGGRHPHHGAGPLLRGAVDPLRPVLRQPRQPRGGRPHRQRGGHHRVVRLQHP
jgi:hypothetical protein